MRKCGRNRNFDSFESSWIQPSKSRCARNNFITSISPVQSNNIKI